MNVHPVLEDALREAGAGDLELLLLQHAEKVLTALQYAAFSATVSCSSCGSSDAHAARCPLAATLRLLVPGFAESDRTRAHVAALREGAMRDAFREAAAEVPFNPAPTLLDTLNAFAGVPLTHDYSAVERRVLALHAQGVAGAAYGVGPTPTGRTVRDPPMQRMRPEQPGRLVIRRREDE